MNNSSNNIIDVKNLTFSYNNGTTALDNISLSIVKGDYVGIIGPNGGGKSTLIKIMLGLIKSNRNNITLFGSDINNFKKWSKVGYVSQKVTNFDTSFPISVHEVVSMSKHGFFQPFGIESRADKNAIDDALNEVGMLNHKDDLLKNLSGGQQQKVFIARALASNPEILFLDEPTSGIDAKAQDSFYDLLRRLNKEKNITLIMVSHDIKRVMQETNKLAFLKKGLVYYGDTAKIMDNTSVKQILNDNLNIIEMIGSGHNHA